MEAGGERILVNGPGDAVAQEIYFAEVYKKYFKQTKAYVLKNNGTADDADDIFQEVMLVLLTKTKDPDFKLTSSLGTWLFAVTRNLWRNRLKEKLKMPHADLHDEIPENLPETNETLPKKKLMAWITQITEHCQRLIASLFFFKEPMANLVVRMGWKNKHTADNQKYKCIQQLKKVRQNEREPY